MSPVERTPFYDAEDAYRQAVAHILADLTDEELEQVYALFDRSGDAAAGIPPRYRAASFRVRAAVKQEQKRRKESR